MPAGRKDIKPRWKKGQSGNPNGRPRVLPELREVLTKVLMEEKDGKTALEAMVIKARNQAIQKGDMKAFTILLERAFGKVTQKVEIENLPDVSKVDWSKLAGNDESN